MALVGRTASSRSPELHRRAAAQEVDETRGDGFGGQNGEFAVR